LDFPANQSTHEIFTYDIDLAIKSLKKLIQMDIENVICYHGGLYKGNANQRIAELAKG
jgi:glyoxylase-like metal-dependent hydrolase (beta-lactamase superfamily II)